MNMCGNDEGSLRGKRQLLWRGQVVAVDVIYEMSKGNAVTFFQTCVAENLLIDRFDILKRLPGLLSAYYRRTYLNDMDDLSVLHDMTPVSVVISQEREWQITFSSAMNNGVTIVAKICGVGDKVSVELSV